jgi:hypothetical protein
VSNYVSEIPFKDRPYINVKVKVKYLPVTCHAGADTE